MTDKLPNLAALQAIATKAAATQHLDLSRPAVPADHSEMDPKDLEPFNPATFVSGTVSGP